MAAIGGTSRLRHDSGQGILEYVGVLLVVMAMLTGILSWTRSERVGDQVDTIVEEAICAPGDCFDASRVQPDPPPVNYAEERTDQSCRFSCLGRRAFDTVTRVADTTRHRIDTTIDTSRDRFERGWDRTRDRANDAAEWVLDNTTRAYQFLNNAKHVANAIKRAFAGCVEVLGDLVGTVKSLFDAGAEFIDDPEAFLGEKMEAIRTMIAAAQDDPAGFALEFLKGVVDAELYEEDPVKWAGKMACEIGIEILTGFASGRLFAKAFGTIEKFFQRFNKKNGNNKSDSDEPDTDEPDTAPHPNRCRINSFPTGTEVLLADGSYRAIEHIQPGDVVVGRDPATGVFSNERVLDQWSHLDTGQMVTVSLDDASSVTATDHHKFWLESDLRWRELVEVSSFDRLLSRSGPVEVASVRVHPHSNTLVWELDVAGPDTFHVSTGTTDLLVHNSDGTEKPSGCRLSPEEIRHILDGDEDGGFHHRENGVDPEGATFIKERSLKVHSKSPWKSEKVYKADIRIGKGEVKTSNFFPDDWSRERVIRTVEEALNNRVGTPRQGRDGATKEYGVSEDGYLLEIVLDTDGNLLTAYPEVGRPPWVEPGPA